SARECDALTARQIPADRPPPPQGTIMASIAISSGVLEGHSHLIARRNCATSYGGADTARTQYADGFDLRYWHIQFAPVYFPEPSSASTSGFTLAPSSSIERRNALCGICPTSI